VPPPPPPPPGPCKPGDPECDETDPGPGPVDPRPCPKGEICDEDGETIEVPVDDTEGGKESDDPGQYPNPKGYSGEDWVGVMATEFDIDPAEDTYDEDELIVVEADQEIGCQYTGTCKDDWQNLFFEPVTPRDRYGFFTPTSPH